LLARHRYLALARASVSQRLGVLRLLISADPSSPCWKREIEELETARLGTLRNEISAALEASDAAAIDRLVTELQNGPWLTPVPAEIRAALTSAAQTLRRLAAIEALWALVPAVREAYAAMSVEQCRQVFAQWGKVVKEARLIVPPELRQEILPMAHWLDAQDDRREREREFKLACATLSAAIDAAAPLEQLTALQGQALGLDFDLPPELAAAYRRALDAGRREKRAEKRRQVALAVVLIGAIVMALGALAYVILTTTPKK
jgi:hypothetical protein